LPQPSSSCWETFLSEPSLNHCDDVLSEVLARHGAADHRQVLYALLGLLRDQHRVAAADYAGTAYREGFELPDARASTLAETIRDIAASRSGSPQCAASEARGQSGGNGAPRPGALELQIIADVLRDLIAVWDFEVSSTQAATRKGGATTRFVAYAHLES